MAIAKTVRLVALTIFVQQLLICKMLYAHSDRPPPALADIPVPKSPGLYTGVAPIIKNREIAVVLGKTLFWDSLVGSDGVACATCHYHAGADVRAVNQLATGELRQDGATTGETYQKTAANRAGGPNYRLHRSDFPFHQFDNLNDNTSIVKFSTDDIVGSGGGFGGQFVRVYSHNIATDQCQRKPEQPYTLNGVGFRHPTQRNAPTVINAVFNQRNFWDGRANNIFNGRNPFGLRDNNAFIWVNQSDTLSKKRLRLSNASLASQASGPPLDATEMSCEGRTFADIARKLLQRHPLELQQIHPHDSVLAKYRSSTGKGLDLTYANLIRNSFNSRYWQANLSLAEREQLFGKPKAGGPPYHMIEANFSMFFSLAVQSYLATLISDQSPFDTPWVYDNTTAKYYPKGLNQQQRRGMVVFLDAHCTDCHNGPTLSTAADPTVVQYGGSYINRNTVNRRLLYSGHGLIDQGYANTGVVASAHDMGLGSQDPFGNPLSFSAQYVQKLLGKINAEVDNYVANSCDFDFPSSFIADFKKVELTQVNQSPCFNPLLAVVPLKTIASTEYNKAGNGRLRSGVEGAFKIPTLRNVELTGPYMHNGGMATLEQVAQFYSRAGNFKNPQVIGISIFQQDFTSQQIKDLVAFLKSLTDERVRWEKAPFDHPSLLIPHGHNTKNVDADGLAQDNFIKLPAIGKNGRSLKQGPLTAFEQLLPN